MNYDELDRESDANQLAFYVKKLAIAREKKKLAHDLRMKMIADLEATPGYKNMLELESLAADDELAAREAIELLTVNNLATHPAVKVKTKTVVVWLEPEQTVFQWALERFQAVLSLDRSKFDKAAKEGYIPPAYARVDKEPQVTIAQDLSAYLPQDNQADPAA